MNNVLEEIMNWNEERGNTTYSCVREGSMIQEELEELGAAYRGGDIVDEADALGDIIFVAVGSLYKLCGGDKDKVYDILLAITAANNLKSSTKDSNGKITKPKDFVGPEEMIRKVLCK
jgi:predicted HAD superfamily Cof-like phosphohydrolase